MGLSPSAYRKLLLYESSAIVYHEHRLNIAQYTKETA